MVADQSDSVADFAIHLRESQLGLTVSREGDVLRVWKEKQSVWDLGLASEPCRFRNWEKEGST